MMAICANPASPLGENDFFRNQTGKLGFVQTGWGGPSLALGNLSWGDKAKGPMEAVPSLPVG